MVAFSRTAMAPGLWRCHHGGRIGRSRSEPPLPWLLSSRVSMVVIGDPGIVRVDIMTAPSPSSGCSRCSISPLGEAPRGASSAGLCGSRSTGSPFRYPERGRGLAGPRDHRARRPQKGPILEDISFEVEPGQTVALVGPSGSGKTTITNLVARLYDPTSGAIRLTGVPSPRPLTSPLRATVGVDSEAHLFDTIRANLLYARPDADAEEQIRTVLERAPGDPSSPSRAPRRPGHCCR